jgi:hypothetical protein
MDRREEPPRDESSVTLREIAQMIDGRVEGIPPSA